MEINILYSKNNADHLRTADFVRRAVKHLGITATIIERDVPNHDAKVVVDGFDLIGEQEPFGSGFSFEMIKSALEQTAWTHI